MKIKIFESVISADDIENKIAQWADPINSGLIIHSVNVSTSSMVDYFTEMEVQKICSQWIQYTATIVYELKIQP